MGHVPRNIRSSRVNDGICDCCDASDEYREGSRCADTCLALGAAEREARRQRLLLLRQGSEVRARLIEEAKSTRTSQTASLAALKAQLTQLQAIQAEKEAVKSAAEAREAEAVARFKQANRAASQESQDEEGVRAHEAAEAAAADRAFAHLDSDGDG